MSIAFSAAASSKLLADQAKFGIATGLFEAENYVLRMAGGTTPIIGQALVVTAASKPAPPAVDRLAIMTFQNSKWAEPGGEVRTCAKHGLCSPPRAVAEKAVAANLAVAQNSDRYRKLREIDCGEAYGQQWALVPEWDCLDLVTGEQPKPRGEETAAGPVEYVGPARTGFATISSARW
jgi:hypothetical protein